MCEAPWAHSIFWMYTVLADEAKYGMNSRQLMQKLRDVGIESRSFWHPVYSLPPYADCRAYRVKVADALYGQGLRLPSSVGLTYAEQHRVMEAMAEDRRTRE